MWRSFMQGMNLNRVLVPNATERTSMETEKELAAKMAKEV